MWLNSIAGWLGMAVGMFLGSSREGLPADTVLFIHLVMLLFCVCFGLCVNAAEEHFKHK
jgi:hypothetical protein